MSELINKNDNRATMHWKLLTGASALALTAYIVPVSAEDAGQPQFWIELGGQLQRLEDSQESFSPPFMTSITQPNLLSALNVQKPPHYAIGEDAKLSFQPENSDWVFSASIQYGRSSTNQHHHQQTANKTVPVHFAIGNKYVGPKYYYPYAHVKFADGRAHFSETHAILDFQAGKDVGLGLFGGKGSSVLSGGVRIAQFMSKANINLRAMPDVHYPTAPIVSLGGLAIWLDNYHPRFHAYTGTLMDRQGFDGIGPSLAWSASVPFAGDVASGRLSLDWGINGAILFGRQSIHGSHKTTMRSYYDSGAWHKAHSPQGKITPGFFQNQVVTTCDGGTLLEPGPGPNVCSTNTTGVRRERSVTVPNVGGFAGVSFRLSNFKVALGYRADFFFNAMDGGIDTRKSENRAFYGPYASISIGIGD